MATIVTFYSYKGGTGRSMALANVAWILASAGQRVLVVDWDLEAPGLHHYFRPFLPDAELLAMDVRGVIDFVFEYVAVAATPLPQTSDGRAAVRPKDWYKPYADIRQCAIPLCWPSGEQVRFGNRGGIDFVPAGRQIPDVYAARVNGFNWLHFYEHQSGGAFMDAVRDNMQSYDYVLIDSRTGVSDTAGICTVQMPDLVVLCFTLNNQSIKGASGVAAQLATALKARPVLPVPMRIDPFEKDKLNKRREYAHLVFGKLAEAVSNRFQVDPARYWSDVEIPYFASYAYEELLAPFEKFSGSLGSMLPALEKLTGYISDHAVQRFSAVVSEAQRSAVVAAYEQTQIPGVESPGDVQTATTGDAQQAVDDRVITMRDVTRTFFRWRYQMLAVLLIAAALAVGIALFRGRVPRQTITRQQAIDERPPVAVVEALRNGTGVDGAVATLTRLLDTEQESVVRARLFRDRAYGYKRLGQWTAAIEDLSQALMIEKTGPNAVSAFEDRAFAYLKVTELESAISDYDAVVSLNPRDERARAAAKRVRELLKRTQPSPLFVFLPSGGATDPTKLPTRFPDLGPGYRRFNLRFWWHPITNRIRYTDAGDEKTAIEIADRVRQAGFTLSTPESTRALVTHERRIEIWLNERKE